jgi:hypothetical protein
MSVCGDSCDALQRILGYVDSRDSVNPTDGRTRTCGQVV